MKRREFLTGASMLAATGALGQGSRKRPNVVLIMTDDQGFGDIGINGNPKVRTPNMDRIAREGVQFSQFHVCPVCSPTRSTLLTGRYNYRTGVVDTYLGRSMMRPDEVTIAEMLKPAGYRTGIFGKWHLGDNYPLRPGEHGFEDSVVIKGGGLAQPSDFPESKGYFDPVLLRNGKPERFKGYCTDIFVDETLRFLEENKDRPFFVYLPTNAPHSPLQVPEKDLEPYKDSGLEDTTARIYAMVSNADANIGRVLSKLKELGLEDNTLLIFLTDNGPQQKRFNAGMRGLKGTVYEGGTRVPFFVRWPGVVKPGTSVDRLAGHIDVLPTLLEACGASAPKNDKLDGRSLVPLLRNPKAQWADRTMFFQWHRGDAPELYRACAARNQRWKMVNGKELYDLQNDPAEAKDLAAERPEVLAKLRGEYEAWFRDVTAKGFEPTRISIGTSHENPVMLTRQDWRGPRAGWDENSLGYWEVQVAATAPCEFSVRFAPAKADGVARVKLNGASVEKKIQKGDVEAALGRGTVQSGPGRLEAEVQAGDTAIGVHYVTVRRV